MAAINNPGEFPSLIGTLRMILLLQRLGFTPLELGQALIAWRYQLSREEVQLLQQIAEGFTNPEIAEILGVAEEKTVKSRIHRLYAKLGATGKVRASVLAAQFELFAPKVSAPTTE